MTINIQDFIDAIAKLSNAEQLALSKVIWEESLNSVDFLKTHKVITGVRTGDLIPFGDKGNGYTFMKSTRENSSQCDDNACDLTVVLSNKSWAPGRYNCAVETCYKDLTTLMLDYFNSDVCSFKEFSTSFYVAFLVDMIGGHVTDSLWVKTYFAELTATATYLDGNDGLFIQLITLAAADTSLRVTIPENATATYVLQEALAADRGFETFNAMYKQRKLYLKKNKKAYIKTTRLLAENYLEWLRNEKQVVCCQKDPLQGIYTEDKLTIFGIPIIIIDQWDEIINALPEFNDATKWDNPHRAVLAFWDDLPVGTCEVGNFSAFDVKTNDYDELLKIKPEYTLDTKVLKNNGFILAI